MTQRYDTPFESGRWPQLVLAKGSDEEHDAAVRKLLRLAGPDREGALRALARLGLIDDETFDRLRTEPYDLIAVSA